MDHSGAYYSETQHINKALRIFVVIMMTVVPIIALSIILMKIYHEAPESERERAMFTFILINCIVVVIDCIVAFLFLKVRLETVLKPDGLYLQLFPIKFKPQKISLDNVAEVTIEEINSYKEFRGKGYRKRSNNELYLLKGKRGIRIKYNTGNYVFIGSQTPEKLYEWLKNTNMIK